MPSRALLGLGVLVVIALAVGCVHYPTVDELGSVRVQPENARLVREPDGSARFYVLLRSTGKFGDVLTAGQLPIAREARLDLPEGATRLQVPGIAVVGLRPGGPHVRFTGFTRALVPGEVLIVTLVFEKLGNLGVVTVVE